MSLIIVGLDGSEQSERALGWALQYGAARSLPVQAVTVVNTKDLDEGSRAKRLAEAERSASEMVRRAVDACCATPTVTYEVVEGDPGIVLVDATHRAELIVLGSHPMSSLRNAALGTVSLACIRMGSCPVLVVPVAAPDAALCGDLVPV
jgi:nucleotide-binding universal stress UspA family protein